MDGSMVLQRWTEKGMKESGPTKMGEESAGKKDKVVRTCQAIDKEHPWEKRVKDVDVDVTIHQVYYSFIH